MATAKLPNFKSKNFLRLVSYWNQKVKTLPEKFSLDTSDF